MSTLTMSRIEASEERMSLQLNHYSPKGYIACGPCEGGARNVGRVWMDAVRKRPLLSKLASDLPTLLQEVSVMRPQHLVEQALRPGQA